MSHADSPDEPNGYLLFAPVRTAYRGANAWSSDVQRAFVAAPSAIDIRDAFWDRDGVRARTLLDAATELLNGRETCEAPPRPASSK